ncbi:MAG: toprim domain-containing protein, partial [Pseudomonadota bacterium]
EQWFVAGDRQVLSEPADSLLQQQFSCLQAADARLHASLQRSFADQDITVKDGKFDKEGIDDCKDGDFQRNDLRRQLAELVLNKKQQQEIRNESVAQHELREDLDAARVQRNTCAHGLMQHAFFSVGVRLSSSSHLERIIAFDRAHRIREILKKYQISQEAKLDSTPFVKKIQDHLNYDAYKGDSLTYQTMSQSKISVEFAKAGKGVSNGIDPRIDPGFDKGFAKSSGSIPNAASSFNARSSYTDAANFARYDLDTVKNICQRDAEKLATHLLGISPNKSASSAKEVRYGRKGSFVLTLQGRRAGKWQDFETGEGGNLFALVGREQGITEFKDQLKYVAEFYGIAPESHNKESHNKESYHEESYHEERYDKNAMPELLQNTQKQEAQKETAAIAEEKERQAKLEAVAGLYRQSKPIQGSIAETYLRETRGIQGTLPDDLRFIPKGTAFVYKGKQQTTKYDCMAAVGRNFDGEILSIQVTSLNPQAQRAVGRDGKKLNKLKYGIGTGSFVVVQQSQNQESQDKERVWIAEGVETALSLKEAGVKDKIVVSQGIGNIANYQGDEREIILCADNDGLESATAKTIQKAAATLEEKGFAVQIIQPEQKGQDFNDVLLKEGKSKVAEYTSAVDLPSSQTLQKKIAGVQPEISSTASQMSPNTTDIKSQDEAPQARVARDKVAEIARSIELLEQRIAASREEGDWDTFDLSHKQRREVMAKLESDPRNVEALKHNHPQVYEKVAHEVERELSLER